MKRLSFTFSLIVSASVLFAQREVFVKGGDAIQGYDPVAYFTQATPVKGNKEFTYLWKDANWSFANKENLAAFKADPEKFAPQFGGYCAYGMMEGHKAPTQPDAWTIVDGKLYLNYNKNVRELWSKNQPEYIRKAIENWPTVKLEKD